MRHADITGVQAIHPFAFVSETDPALDPGNEVGPGKAWFRPSTRTVLLRSQDNTEWLRLGGLL